jgi:lipopolysaccharide cholinephosphotransferase
MKDQTREEIIVENLKDIKEVFDDHNIQFWLDWGTLLGATRTGRMIEWDHEVDLGVMESNFKRIIPLLSEIERKGFFIKTPPISASELTFRRYGYGVDIWLYYPVNKNLLATPYYILSNNLIARTWWFLWRAAAPAYGKADLPQQGLKLFIALAIKQLLLLLPNKTKESAVKSIKKKLTEGSHIVHKQAVAPKHYLEEFKTIKFYGMIFNVPANSEGYLEYKYGKTWRTPIKQWDPWTEDGSVRLAGKYEKQGED